jgi:hypothetical protein
MFEELGALSKPLQPFRPATLYFLKEAGSDLCVEVRLEALLLYSESSVVELVFKRSGFGFC